MDGVDQDAIFDYIDEIGDKSPFDEIDNKFNEMNNKIDEMNIKIDKHKTQMSKLVNAYKSQKKDINLVNEEQSNIMQKIKDENELQNNQIQKLKTETKEQNNLIQKLKTENKEQNSQILKLKDKNEALSKQNFNIERIITIAGFNGLSMVFQMMLIPKIINGNNQHKIVDYLNNFLKLNQLKIF